MKSQEKAKLRALFAASHQKTIFSLPQGKIAEQLRRADIYREAKQLFVSPHQVLDQIRINALLDGKELIMPGPGLQEGFYRVRPYRIPFRDIPYGVSFKGLSKYAQNLATNELSDLHIQLMVTDALAIDSFGRRLGDGHGFFDLSCSLLSQCGALAQEVTILAAVAEEQIQTESLPLDPWDVMIDGILLANGIRFFAKRSSSGQGILWDFLDMKRIRKIKPLWELYQNKLRK